VVPENLEEPKFEIIEIYDGFEIRKYVDTIQARVATKGMGYRNSAGAFRRIASYIFGENNQSRNIAMTAPVHMWESDDSSVMAFTMPSEHRMGDLPKPADSGVELLHVKGEVVAVLKFSGLSHRRKSLRMISSETVFYRLWKKKLFLSSRRKRSMQKNFMILMEKMNKLCFWPSNKDK